MAKKRSNRSTSNPAGAALTAAAQTIDLTKPVYTANRRNFTQAWQARAWEMYEEVGEVSAAANYMGDAFSGLRLFIAAQVDNELVELNPDDPPDGFTSEQIIQAQDILAMLEYPHGLAELQRMAGIALFQVGEVYILGRENEEGEEEWDTYSTEQIFINSSDKYAIKGSPNDTTGTPINEDTDVLMRIWRRSPRWPQQATSSVKSALTVLEELLLLTLEVRAVTMSRIPAGLLVFPDSMEAVRTDYTSDDAGTNGTASEMLTALQRHFTTPISSPGDASAVVPFLMKAHPDDIEKITSINFGRDISAAAQDQRKELIERFAAAINLPGEIITGKGGLNHWSAWLIDTEALNNHIQPMAKVLTNGLTAEYLLPRLSIDAVGNTVENVPPFVIGFELADQLEDPELTKTLFEAYQSPFLISNDAMAKRLNISDEERPDEAEIAQRIELMSKASAGAIPGGGKQTPPDPETITSSAQPRGRQLHVAAYERELRVRLQVTADAAMHRALERAGAKLRSLSQKDKSAKAAIAASGVPNELLVSEFPELLASVGQTPHELLAGAFNVYGETWGKHVKQASTSLIAQLGLSKHEQATAELQYDHYRTTTQPVLVTGLTSLAASLIYNPSLNAPDIGEFEPDMKVPSGLIRNSLILAGGSSTTIDAAAAPIGLDGAPVGGLYSSAVALGLFAQSPLVPDQYKNEYTWIYGDPGSRINVFEDHYNLDGYSFTSWTDDRLTADVDWTDTPGGFYYPGDHDTCQCDFDYSITLLDSGDSEGEEEDAG